MRISGSCKQGNNVFVRILTNFFQNLQALSISRSLFEAKAAAEKGKLVCSDLRRSVIEKIEAAGGKVDYVEVRHQVSSV